ncbi:hypothetical protein LCM02_02215 [Lutimonas saemankumensis]|uniref:hypothetical protein n=1 Tax=Lutimonas saemankumensis TaxID=483016 RepID=UPI001CD77811|nr:hypothetical protein [Lutimonas saemankumensis]MCA0931248.1 hypothetical protein [Lutimonas saemankumensis]
MKKLIITHLLLNLYLLVLVQPAIPVLEYLINYDYIVNELCENREKPIQTCNGKCYLGDKVEKQLNLDPEPQLPVPPQVDLEKFITLGVEFDHEISNPETMHLELPTYFNRLKPQLQGDSLLRPPKDPQI